MVNSSIKLTQGVVENMLIEVGSLGDHFLSMSQSMTDFDVSGLILRIDDEKY